MSEETPPPNDPLKLMREAYAQGVERWSEAMEKLVSSEDFAAASGQLLSLYAQQQQSVRAASRIAAESIQMPTTEDLAAVAQLVINVERKVDEIADQVAAMAKQLAALSAAPAKRSPGGKPAAASGTKAARAPRASG
jgi:polyhydroxyalkanoic acid synthase PhaR subunit